MCLVSEREAESFVEDRGDGAGAGGATSVLVEASKRVLRQRDARLTLAAWRATAARVSSPGVHYSQA